jgi:hypothetical protein
LIATCALAAAASQFDEPFDPSDEEDEPKPKSKSKAKVHSYFFSSFLALIIMIQVYEAFLVPLLNLCRLLSGPPLVPSLLRLPPPPASQHRLPLGVAARTLS